MLNELVLVTNAASHISSHIIKQLLQNGYLVRGVLSTKDLESSKSLRELCSDRSERLQLVEANTLDLPACRILVNDCTFVIHVASPRPLEGPQHYDDLWIGMTRTSTLNVLQACQENGRVEKVVITGSCLAVHDLFSTRSETVVEKGDNANPPGAHEIAPPFHLPVPNGNANNNAGHHNHNPIEVYNESSWTDIVGVHTPLVTCKVSAERSAWDYVHSLHKSARFSLTVMLPTLVLGPVLHRGEQVGIGKQLTQYLIRHSRGFLPVPNLMLPVCDVRDVAMAHVRALTMRESDGMRIIIATHTVGLTELAASLQRNLDPLDYRVKSNKQAPSELMTKLSCMLLGSDLRRFSHLLTRTIVYDNTRMRNILDFEPILADKSVVDMADSLIQRGDIKLTDRYANVMHVQPEANYFQQHQLMPIETDDNGETILSRKLRKRWFSGDSQQQTSNTKHLRHDDKDFTVNTTTRTATTTTVYTATPTGCEAVDTEAPIEAN